MARKKREKKNRRKKNRERKNRGNEIKFSFLLSVPGKRCLTITQRRSQGEWPGALKCVATGKPGSAGCSPFDEKEVNRCCTLSCLLVTIGVFVVVVILGIALICNSDLIKSPYGIPEKKFAFIDDCQQVSIVPTVSSGKMSYSRLLQFTDSQIPKYMKFDSGNCTTQIPLNHFAFNDTCLEIFVPQETTLPDVYCWKLQEISRNVSFDTINFHWTFKSWVTENVYHFAINDSCQEISVLPDIALIAIRCWRFRMAADIQSGKASSSNNQASSSSHEMGSPLQQSFEQERPSPWTNNTRGLSCKSNLGRDVDWYYLYNLPSHSNNPNSDGTRFYYLHNNRKQFVRSRRTLLQRGQLIDYTLRQIQENNEVLYLLYNDQSLTMGENPWRRNNLAHAKGVIAFNGESGFWMVHSVPNFPKVIHGRISHDWPDNAVVNGQSVLCVTFPTDQMLRIVQEQLRIFRPKVYFTNMGEWLEAMPPQEVFFHRIDVKSRGNQNFTHYAKHHSLRQDFYIRLAQELQCNLRTSTYRRGRGEPLPSHCDPPFYVENIRQSKFGNAPTYPETKEHSKWAISNGPPSEKTFVCIGDFNRVESQHDRSGGTLCANIPEVWNKYRRTIVEVQECP